MSGLPPARAGRVPGLVLGALLVVAAAATHWASLEGPFLYDDYRFVRDNARLASPAILADAFVDPLATDPTGSGGGIYRPLRTIAFAAIRAAFGSEPLPYHAASLFLHALNSLLAFGALRAFLAAGGVPAGGARLSAFVAALVFAAHPVQGEAVDWISSLDNLLFAGFALAALWLHLARPAGPLPDLGVGLLYVAALFSKEMAAPLPAILLVADRLAGRRFEGRAFARRYGLLAAGLAVYLIARGAVLEGEFDQRGPWGGSLVTHAAVAVQALGHDALRLLFPFYPDRFAFDWQMPIPGSVFEPRVVVAAAAAAALAAVAVRGIARREPIGCCVAAFLLARLPASQVPFPLNIAVADRFLYLPLVFGAGASALALDRAFRRARPSIRVPLAAGAAAYGVLLASLTAVNASLFADEFRLWMTVAARDPESFRARHGLGAVLAREGRLADATREFILAESLRPDSPEVKRDLGSALIATGFKLEGAERLAEGVRLLRERGVDSSNPELTEMAFAAGETFSRAGVEDRAAAMIAALFPDPPWARGAFFVRRGDLRAAAGDEAGARSDWDRALAVEPDYAPARLRGERR